MASNIRGLLGCILSNQRVETFVESDNILSSPHRYEPTKDMKAPNTYWQRRSRLLYYQEALRFCREFGKTAGSALEVGSKNTPFMDWLDWIPRKTAIDRDCTPNIVGATNIKVDFLEWNVTESFDLAVCLQVLEHIKEVKTFARKLLRCAATVVVSVPYRWKPGYCKWHCQDPILLRDLNRWFGQPALAYTIVRDYGDRRLVAAYRNSLYTPPDGTDDTRK